MLVVTRQVHNQDTIPYQHTNVYAYLMILNISVKVLGFGLSGIVCMFNIFNPSGAGCHLTSVLVSRMIKIIPKYMYI